MATAQPVESWKVPWTSYVRRDLSYSSVEHKLHYEILAFLAYMEQTMEEKKVREILLEDIRKIVAQLYGDATIHLFGSSVTGLDLPISDLDVSVKAPHIRNVRKALFQFSNRLTVRGLTDRAAVAVGAPVPIITFETTPSRGSIHVDININDESDVKGTEIIQTYISQMPALRPLVLLMKTFLLQRGLNNASRGGLGSYALVCMCIHFLKANPGNRSSEEISDPMTSESLGVLLRDFLYYYGTQFDYETTYISTSVAPGKELKKDTDANEGKISRLSVRCLFNTGNEIAKSVGKPRELLDSFRDAYQELSERNPSDYIILGRIIHVNQDFLDKRALLFMDHFSEDPDVDVRPQRSYRLSERDRHSQLVLPSLARGETRSHIRSPYSRPHMGRSQIRNQPGAGEGRNRQPPERNKQSASNYRPQRPDNPYALSDPKRRSQSRGVLPKSQYDESYLNWSPPHRKSSVHNHERPYGDNAEGAGPDNRQTTGARDDFYARSASSSRQQQSTHSRSRPKPPLRDNPNSVLSQERQRSSEEWRRVLSAPSESVSEGIDNDWPASGSRVESYGSEGPSNPTNRRDQVVKRPRYDSSGRRTPREGVNPDSGSGINAVLSVLQPRADK